MAKVLIPTPLRQYAEKQDSVELTGSTVGEVLSALTSAASRTCAASSTTTKASCAASSTCI